MLRLPVYQRLQRVGASRRRTVRTPIAVVEPPTGDDVPDTARERGEMVSEPTSLGTDQARRAGLKATRAMDC